MATTLAPIAPKLQGVLEKFAQVADQSILGPIAQSKDEITATFDPSAAPAVGSTLPFFSLPNATGKTVTLSDVLSKRPGTKGALITFYRGGWCPFCNIALHGLQERLADFTAAGVQLVAISPELPDQTLSTAEKQGLQFEVLTDRDTAYAKKLGIMWQMPEYLHPALKKIGHDFLKFNGNEDYTVPVPANILVDGEGKVRNIHVDPDYTKRLEPATAVEWAKAL